MKKRNGLLSHSIRATFNRLRRGFKIIGAKTRKTFETLLVSLLFYHFSLANQIRSRRSACSKDSRDSSILGYVNCFVSCSIVQSSKRFFNLFFNLSYLLTEIFVIWTILAHEAEIVFPFLKLALATKRNIRETRWKELGNLFIE